MKKVICMVALAAIGFGNVYAAIPLSTTHMQTDTGKMMKKKKKKMKMNSDSSKMKMKKDTSKM